VRVFLETERLILRRFTPDDVDDLVELDSDPSVMRLLTNGVATTRTEINDVVLPGFLREYLPGAAVEGAGHWAVIDKAAGAFVGWIALEPHAERTDLELGYRLRRSAWGHGFATEGSRAAVDKAFTELGVDRVWAQTMAVNTASRRVMEKCGLTLVRTFHLEFDDPIPGTEFGEVEYAITRAAWIASRGLDH
jgi:RimJ/RimL family protein N-acetyltransferase